MDTLTTALNPFNIKYVYGFFGGKKREKLDFILEPLQAMLQLSMLSFCPIGSKLTINDNLLGIQLPGMSQGIVRFFNDDAKEDLYYLFNVFRRFVSYYSYLRKDSRYRPLYELLIELSKHGLNNLIQTYTDCNKINVLHTLTMYKVMLEKPEFFNPEQPVIEVGNDDIQQQQSTVADGSQLKNKAKHQKQNSISVHEFDKVALSSKTGNNPSMGPGTSSLTNIDTIFDKIVSIYSPEELNIIYNTLLLMTRCENQQSHIDLMNGLNMIMTHTYFKIKKWIKDNIAL
jgi:hypothetical protein